jgi:hypothetical protein
MIKLFYMFVVYLYGDIQVPFKQKKLKKHENITV